MRPSGARAIELTRAMQLLATEHLVSLVGIASGLFCRWWSRGSHADVRGFEMLPILSPAISYASLQFAPLILGGIVPATRPL